MTNATETNATNAATETTTQVAPGANAAPAAPKAPSKKSLALAIFSEQMTKRAAGEFATNKAFRRTVLDRIVAELEVSMASASTMYNVAKKEAETADASVGLGRDPKKEKPAKVEGAKRGRPQGSKNKPKEVVAADATPVAAEAAPVADNTVVIADPVAPAADTEALPA